MKYRDENGIWQELYVKSGGDTLPIGTVVQYSGEKAPYGWMICDGSLISRIDYSELFNAIGTLYGEGDGSTTFALPNYKGKIGIGFDKEDTDFNEIGKLGGNKEHTLTLDEVPRQCITLSYNNTGNFFGNYTADNNGNQVADKHTQQPFDIVQPYIVTNYIIKVKQAVGVVGTVVDTLDVFGPNYVPNVDAINKRDTYSTKEQRIGTWIDGKPLYRKSYVLSKINDLIYDMDLSSLNLDHLDVAKAKCSYNFNNTKFGFYNNYYIDNTDTFRIFERGTGIRIVQGSTQTKSTNENKKIEFTLEYTKATNS